MTREYLIYTLNCVREQMVHLTVICPHSKEMAMNKELQLVIESVR